MRRLGVFIGIALLSSSCERREPPAVASTHVPAVEVPPPPSAPAPRVEPIPFEPSSPASLEDLEKLIARQGSVTFRREHDKGSCDQDEYEEVTLLPGRKAHRTMLGCLVDKRHWGTFSLEQDGEIRVLLRPAFKGDQPPLLMHWHLRKDSRSLLLREHLPRALTEDERRETERYYGACLRLRAIPAAKEARVLKSLGPPE